MNFEQSIVYTEQFFSLVRQYGDVPDHDLRLVVEKSRLVTMRQGEHFLRSGQVCHQIGLIIEGIFRIYMVDDEGREIIRLFPSERSFVVDINSYFNQIPSTECWEALTDVRMMMWDRPTLDFFERTIPTWYPVTNNMVQRILSGNMMELSEMFNDDATTRYRKFMERYPHDLARIPLRHLASYLGIAPQSLSRIRQQLAKH